MFGFHPDNRIGAYIQGELNAKQAGRFEAHLQGCARCRQKLETLRNLESSLSHLPSLNAPDGLWARIEIALPETPHPAHIPLSPRRMPHRMRSRLILAAAACALLVAAFVTWSVLHPPRPGGPAWIVDRLAGAPRIGKERIQNAGRLGVGAWLETDGVSRAEIRIADIGTAQIEPNSRIGLKRTGPNGHRLELTRGEMHATVLAPPRLFLVDTPTATAIDLGCAYTLKVDDAGNTWLNVTSGHVALQLHGSEVNVPRGANCETRPGFGTGTPFFADAPPAFQRAVARLDFEQGGDADLNVVLQQARLQDTLTLWNLLYRVNPTQRGQVIDHMMQLIPPPEGVMREAALRLDARTLELWRADLEIFW